eukprot:1814697-Rhodomonas_salina.2
MYLLYQCVGMVASDPGTLCSGTRVPGYPGYRELRSARFTLEKGAAPSCRESCEGRGCNKAPHAPRRRKGISHDIFSRRIPLIVIVLLTVTLLTGKH